MPYRYLRMLPGSGAVMDLAVLGINLIQYVTGSKARKVAALTSTITYSYEVDVSTSL